jgi:hypothetical protein
MSILSLYNMFSPFFISLGFFLALCYFFYAALSLFLGSSNFSINKGRNIEF